ncbi:alkaline shock response membrane anchor protein AmaP, partial [Saccharopolyspora shandongensis]
LVEEIETYPGVHRARARLAGTRAHPVLHLAVVTEDRADIREVRHRIDTEAIPRMRQALELEHLDSDLLLRLGTAHSARTH